VVQLEGSVDGLRLYLLGLLLFVTIQMATVAVWTLVYILSCVVVGNWEPWLQNFPDPISRVFMGQLCTYLS